MRTLADLEFLNGLKVEREILEEEGEYADEDDENSMRKSNSPVKEQPSEEDMEDEDYTNGNRQSEDNQQQNQNRLSRTSKIINE